MPRVIFYFFLLPAALPIQPFVNPVDSTSKTSQILPSHHCHCRQPRPSLEMHPSPHQAPCAHPGAPVMPSGSHSQRKLCKKQTRFFPFSIQNPTRLLTHSKQSQSFPKPTRPCIIWPWLPAALSSFQSPIAHSGSATLASLLSANHQTQFCPRALALAVLPVRNTLPPDLHMAGSLSWVLA